MPITPNDDKLNIFLKISNDPYIKSLGFNKANIKRVKTTNDEITDKSKNIFIYNNGTEETRNNSIIGVVYQIEICVASDDYNDADRCGEQIMALLDKAEFSNNHTMFYIGGPVPMSPSSSLHSIAYRFMIYETIFNKPKK